MSIRPEYVYSRRYRGKVKGVVLDWSGTTLDAYVIAPALVFVEVFRNQGVEITMEEAREPMGLRKDLHIKVLTEVPEIRERWKEIKGAHPDQSDVDAMFADFVPLQLECLPQYTTLLPGVAATTSQLQAEGIKIGTTTGFTRAMVDILEKAAAKQGYVPDASVAGDEVLHGARPRPFMVYRNLDLLDVSPIQSVVKVDDTISGVGEALEAGCWGVGVARYSNYMNVDSLDEAATLSEEEIERRVARARGMLEKAGAHYVVDSLAELPEVIEDINARLAGGEKP
jgi:phosphonoacetaldehyde hydrolase